MRENKSKLKQLIAYILQRYNNEKLTETKLQKLLYFCDFNHYQQHEESITNYTYRKNNFGPTIMELRSILQEMEQDEMIKIIKDTNFFGNPQTRFSGCDGLVDESDFNDSEMLTITKVNTAYEGLTAREISTLSHFDFPYAATKQFGDKIDYSLVHLRNENPDDSDNEDPEATAFFTSNEFSSTMKQINSVLN
jgi:uncharacterized phage-associated protein